MHIAVARCVRKPAGLRESTPSVETLPPGEQDSHEEGRVYAELFASGVAVRLSHRAADDERRLEALEPELSVRIIDPPE